MNAFLRRAWPLALATLAIRGAFRFRLRSSMLKVVVQQVLPASGPHDPAVSPRGRRSYRVRSTKCLLLCTFRT